MQISRIMFEWESLVERTRADIQTSLHAWKSVLMKSLGKRLKYAYAKGSAFKLWNSPIDYVPIISDVDIHIMLNDNQGLFCETKDAFADAMKLSQEYENQFIKLRPDYLHIPRSQLVLIDKLSDIVNYVPPRIQDVRMIIGEFSEPIFPTIEKIRRIDLDNLLSLAEFVSRIPDRVVDRTGLDFWSIIREMTWRVSPSPVRLLTQSADDPLEVWSWNRARITEELRAYGHDEIANHYRDFYLAGWNLFLSGFTSSSDYRWATKSGYYVLLKCLKVAKTKA
jgi:hypothetical protein